MLCVMSLLCSCTSDDVVIPPQRPGGDNPFNPPLVDVIDKVDEVKAEMFVEIPNVIRISEQVTETLEEMNNYLADNYRGCLHLI